MNPEISVIILSYNFSKYIAECIESIINQTLKPFEIIICDDCSTDNSWDIISRYAELCPSIRAFRHTENAGLLENSAFGYKKSRGEYICSMDGDDRWHPHKLEMEIKALKENPDAKIAYSNVRVIDEQGNRLKEWENGASGDLFYRIFWMRVFSTTENVYRNELVHRSVYDEVGGRDYSLELLVDLDFKYRVSDRFKIVCTGETLVDYRLHGGGIHYNSATDVFNRDNLAILKKISPLVSRRNGPEAEEMKREVERRIKILDSQVKYHLSYLVPYAEICRESIGFEGKDVLEVGGSLPDAYVFEQLKVRSWTCIPCCGMEAFSREKPAGGMGSDMALCTMSDETGPANSDPREGEYRTIPGQIEDLPKSHYGLYDLVFSISGFERIKKFPLSLDKMYLALRPGGMVFTLFSPVWSAHNGHHIPEIKDNYGNVFSSGKNPIPPWAHLILRPADLCRHLYGVTDKDTADLIVYHVYHSPAINRFFTEDYIKFFTQSRFKIGKIENIFPVETQENTLSILETLHPGRSCFTNTGMQVILEKSMEDPGNMAEAIFLNQQGENQFDKGKEKEAFDLFTKAINACSDYAPAYNNRAVLLWHKGDIGAALENFRQSIQIEPDGKDTVINIANCLKSMGSNEDARRICSGYLERNQSDPEVSRILAELGE